MSLKGKVLTVIASLVIIFVIALPAAGQEGTGDVSLSLRLPGSLWNPYDTKDAQVLVSRGRVIGGWPFGGNGEHGGYAGYLFVRNDSASAMANLTAVVDISEPLQFGEYDMATAYHKPTGEHTQTFQIEEIAPGATESIRFSVSVPTVTSSNVASGGQQSEIAATVEDASGTMLASLQTTRPVVPVPGFLWPLSLLCTMSLYAMMIILGRRGELFLPKVTFRDWIYMITVGLLIGLVWHLWIGTTLGFAKFAKGLTSQPFVGQALADIGWYTLFALGVLLVRKPGAATVIAFFHELFYGIGFGSVIPFGTGWYLRPFVVGIAVDLYLAFVYKEYPSLRTEKRFTLGGAVSAAYIGFMPFWWTMIMHITYHPSIANMYVSWNYMFSEAMIRGLGGIVYAVVIAYPLSILLRNRLPESVAPEPAQAAEALA